MKLVITVILECAIIVSAQFFQDEGGSHVDIPQEQLFKRDKGIKLGPETIKSSKFLEKKILPVQYWNPPNKDVEELYFNQKAMHNFNDKLFKTQGFTDTDIIMMNRWHGQEQNENLWEADMILSEKQKAMYTKHGKIYGNTERLMPNFSEPWTSGQVQYFYENEGTKELFGDLQLAMDVWESALGCVKFQLVEVEEDPSKITSRPSRPVPMDIIYYDDLIETTPGSAGTSAFQDSSNTSSSLSPRASALWHTPNLLRVTVGDGCYATVGWRPRSRLVISERCSLGVLVHLLGHVLGLPHEHSRPDRALHLHVHPQNVRTRDFMFLNTEGGSERCSNASDGWYDFHSVMHLDPFGLSANNLSAMSARRFPDTAHMGAAWRRPSYNDVLRLRATYSCPPQAVPEGCGAAPPCVGRLGPDCACAPAEGCGEHPASGGCGADVRLSAPPAAAEQMAPPSPRRRGRACAWRLRAGAACGRVRLTLRLRVEEAARVAAAALGCAPLQIETLDVDPMDAGRNVSGAICLSDFTRWRPHGQGSWVAQKEIVSTSPQLRVLIKSYPVADTALARVLNSLEARIEPVVDKYCHCKLLE